jgi:hypothetical protein
MFCFAKLGGLQMEKGLLLLLKKNKGLAVVLRLILVVAMLSSMFMFIVQPAAATDISHQINPSPDNYILNDSSFSDSQRTEKIWFRVTFESTPSKVLHYVKDPDGVTIYTKEYDIVGRPSPGTVYNEGYDKPTWFDPTAVAIQIVIPPGGKVGFYGSYVEYYNTSSLPGHPEKSSYAEFIVKQRIEVFKYNDLNGNGSYNSPTEGPLSGWSISVVGATSPFQSWSGSTDASGLLVSSWGVPPASPTNHTYYDVMTSGIYTATETLKSGWHNTDPVDHSLHKTCTVPVADPITIFLGNQEIPGIHLTKKTNGTDNDSAPGLHINAVGDPITWTYEVTNTSSVPLHNIVVTDDMGVTPAYQSGDDGDGWLEYGETWIYSASGTAIDGYYSNLGTVVGAPEVGDTVTDSNPDHYYTRPPTDVPASSNLSIWLMVGVLAGAMALFMFRKSRRFTAK